MHSLETSITAWRKSLATTRNLPSEALDELESHLRESIATMVRSGVSEGDAFSRAVAQFGPPQTVASEFQKLKEPGWLPVKIVSGLGIAMFLMLVPVLLNLNAGVKVMLLALHVFTFSLGYLLTLLLGVLGICFVVQRCHSEFTPRRMESISRVCFNFARMGACFLAAGVILGMIWSKIAWGWFWNGDLKEIGALCVLVWLVGFAIACRSPRVGARGLLVSSVLSSGIVCLAWIGPNLLSAAQHSYGTPSFGGLLMVIVLADICFFLLGFAPAGWLRLRKI